ncbi:MAG TPA: hypothetical protein VFH00_11695 [Candidatus Nitrosotalea sp.]|nr:hypothetical protein [Candidatus Nitrosotalea sp.]
MVEPNDVTINTRARLADELASIVEADPRVRRWRRLDFADDGGAVMVVELHHGTDPISRGVIARELEFEAASKLPKLAWLRVQVS